MKLATLARPTLHILLAAAAAGLLAGRAFAAPLSAGDVVEVQNVAGTAFTPSPVGGDANGLFAAVSFSLNGGAAQSAYAGVFSLDFRHSPAESWQNFLSFCLEPDVFLTPFSNPYTVNTVGGAGFASSSAMIGELWGRYRGSVTDDVSAAAFQVALWELAFGATDRDLSAGAFRLTSGGSVGTLAQSWLSSLDGTGPQASGLLVLVNNPQLADRQDLITQVPEPGTLALFGVALIGLALSRRRFTASPR
jgi:hypothetical protein